MSNENNALFNEESRHYIQMLQDLSNRMAENSHKCTTWLLTVSTAMYGLILSNNTLANYMRILYVPCIGFWVLGVYYIVKTKKFRSIQDEYIQKIKAGEDYKEMIYTFKHKNDSFSFVPKFMKTLFTNVISIVPLILILLTSIIGNHIEMNKAPNLEDPLNAIASQQQVISTKLDEFINKYEPIELHNKTFNNSSFFNAENVDSVQIILHQSKP